MTRRSVPTVDLQSWYDAGWAYVRPDFDKPNHSFIEWLSDSIPAYPRVHAANRVPEAEPEKTNGRARRWTQHAD